MKTFKVTPPWIFYRTGTLPPHVKTFSEYDDFYHRYLGKKNAIKGILKLLFGYLPITGIFTAAVFFLLYLPSNNTIPQHSSQINNLTGLVQLQVIIGLLMLVAGILWLITADCFQSIVVNIKGYKKYKSEIK